MSRISVLTTTQRKRTQGSNVHLLLREIDAFREELIKPHMLNGTKQL